LLSLLSLCSLFLLSYFYLLYLHSFPTRRSSDLSPIFLACSMIVSKYKSSLILIPPTLYVLCLSFRNYQHTLFLLVIFFPTLRDRDRKSTRLNSSHVSISYAVFCLKK